MPRQRIHNSLSGQKEEFQPRVPGQVGLYVCGVTVYDDCHLGHARFLLVFDAVVRQLRAQGLRVEYVRNITDIDDKIINRAAELGESIDTLTARYIERFHEDCAALGLLAADQEPRATLHMPQIITMIEALIERGAAYQASNGDVYFAVQKFAEYGRLSGKKLDELRVGARIAADEAKRDALDFVLWKAAKAGEPQWDSPWGPGRPGWHIECSAMSTHCLGHSFDIHGGGMDLKFPHHENEIAQSEAATGERFATTWMHNGFVQVGSEKMSKSLGNFSTIRALLTEYEGEVIRYFILGTHYRSPLVYTREAMDAAKTALRRMYAALDRVPPSGDALSEPALESFAEAMADDFNTAGAFAVLHGLVKALNAAADQDDMPKAQAMANTLHQLGGQLGLLSRDPRQVVQAQSKVDASWVEAQIARRIEARTVRDFALADQIRDELQAAGIQLKDGPEGTSWLSV